MRVRHPSLPINRGALQENYLPFPPIFVARDQNDRAHTTTARRTWYPKQG